MTRLYGEKSWEIPNRLETAIAVAREALDWADGFPISDQSKYTIRLAIEEMLSNTIKYGYDDNQEHLISIQIAADSELIRIELVDDARPFDPTQHPELDIERHLAEGIDGGFGIALVRRICKTVGYRRDGQYNRLALQIAVLDPDEEPSAPPSPP